MKRIPVPVSETLLICIIKANRRYHHHQSQLLSFSLFRSPPPQRATPMIFLSLFQTQTELTRTCNFQSNDDFFKETCAILSKKWNPLKIHTQMVFSDNWFSFFLYLKIRDWKSNCGYFNSNFIANFGFIWKERVGNCARNLLAHSFNPFLNFDSTQS